MHFRTLEPGEESEPLQAWGCTGEGKTPELNRTIKPKPAFPDRSVESLGCWSKTSIFSKIKTEDRGLRTEKREQNPTTSRTAITNPAFSTIQLEEGSLGCWCRKTGLKPVQDRFSERVHRGRLSCLYGAGETRN